MKYFVLPLLALLAGCSPKPAKTGSPEITGTQAERVAAVSQIIRKHAPLPAALDARFLEEQTGDGNLGPSDFAAFYALTIAPVDLPAWQAALAPLSAPNAPARYAAPKQALPWWVSQAEFGKLEFFDPELLTGRSHGWVGIEKASGRIFVYAFTM